MAIHTEAESTMQKGFVKKMDTSGINMMFDTLQKYQYTYPVKSTVRELLSNGIDSTVEKQTAIKILTGQAKVEDFFVEKEGDLYKDSKFDPSYYDLKWLSGKDTVELRYFVGSNTRKDYVTITDYGVGLGGKRLEKYFSLGFSTKRLSKLPLGKFGLGAKSPLSVGVDMYTIESCYNGRLFRFNIYSHKVDSIIPAFNLDQGRVNEFITFNEGEEDEYKVYYLPTEELNRVTITIDAKKHHRDQYIEAVKSQMLYFDKIALIVVDENGTEQSIPYKANIMYEDEFIVLSDNQYFTRPHMLLNGVNYGFIDWNELELENKHGNIGIKVQPEDIDVNPSRESVLWTEQTKKMVTQRFNDVVNIATNMIQEELKEKDIVKWVRTCYTVSGHYLNRQDVLGRLANIVDLNTVKPRFILNDKIKFRSDEPLEGLLMKFVKFGHRTSKETGEVRKIVSRKTISSLFEYYTKPFILIKNDERANNRKDKYLLSLYSDGYVAIYEPLLTEEKILDRIKDGDTDLEEWYNKRKKNSLTLTREDIWNFLKESSQVLFYEKIKVPEDFTGTEEEEIIQAAVEEVVAEVKQAAVSAAERRKMDGTTIIHTLSAEPSKKFVWNKVTGTWELEGSHFTFTKLEYPIRKINDWDESEIYYGNEADASLMHLVGLITLPRQRDEEPYTSNSKKFTRFHAKDYVDWGNSKYWRVKGLDETETAKVRGWKAYDLQHFFDCNVKLIKVAQSNNHLYRDFKHVTSFFVQIKNHTITMSNTLIKWNTARIIREKLTQCAFLYNFEYFNPKYAQVYAKLCKYVDNHYRMVSPNQRITGLDTATYSDMISHLDNVRKFQDFVKDNGDADTIAQLARELFGNKEIKDGMAVEPEIMDDLGTLLEYSLACGDFLNNVGLLTGSFLKPTSYISPDTLVKHSISGDLEVEIRKYLEFRGVTTFSEDVPLQTSESTEETSGEFVALELGL